MLISTATAVLDVRETFELRFEKPVDFAVLNDLLGPFVIKAAAESVRRQWPLAKILIIGSAMPALDDHLYDEAISHQHEKDGLLDPLHFLAKDPRSQRTAGGYVGYQSARSTADESAPRKAVAHTAALGGGHKDVPLAPSGCALPAECRPNDRDAEQDLPFPLQRKAFRIANIACSNTITGLCLRIYSTI